MDSLQSRLDQGDVILIDGGTGTEIERRGVTMDSDAWSAVANKSHPNIIRTVHEDYIRAGAEVITANTYATARHVLETAGLGEDVRSINQAAVRVAREAREEVAEQAVWIAGSMSSTAGFHAGGLPDDEQARASYHEQAEILAEAGVDLIIAEMMTHEKNATLVVESARATGLPVWVGLSAEVNRETGEVLPWGVSSSRSPPGDFQQTVKSLSELAAVQVMGIMHTKLVDFEPVQNVLRKYWSGPQLAYAESGIWQSPSWKFVGVVSPQEYVQAALRWVKSGIQVVGGCCGIGPEHISELKENLPHHLG